MNSKHIRNATHLRSADLQFAVSQDCILQGASERYRTGTCRYHADYSSSFHFNSIAPKPDAKADKSAIQQIPILRYAPRNHSTTLLLTAAIVLLAQFACHLDAAGPRTTLVETGKSYYYDLENRLIRVNGGQVQMAYDGDGHRVRKTGPAVGGGSKTTHYLVDDLNPIGHAQVLEEWETNGTEPPSLVRRYAYGLDLISVRDSSDRRGEETTHYYGYDGHGNVRFLTGEAGQYGSDLGCEAGSAPCRGYSDRS